MTDSAEHSLPMVATQAPTPPPTQSVVDNPDDETPHIGPRVPTKAIQRHVAAFYGVSMDEIMSSRRTARISFARHVAVYLAFALTGRACTHIARMFDVDHTSILYALKRITKMVAADPSLAAEIDGLRAELEAR